ncbi:MAG TPA: hypothetical protein VMM16_03210 [Verrucomicrobiae bacterium]|nr:hypothetical protein [Verrucomicrobiae bacterium]
MRHVRLVFPCFLAILIFPTTAVTQQSIENQTSKSTAHNENGQGKQANFPANVPPESKQGVPLQTPAAEKSDKCICSVVAETDWLSRISNVAMSIGTLALAVIGAVTACIAIRTLRYIACQTQTGTVTARAARDNAQAVINSERAWMVGLKVDTKFDKPPKQNENAVYFCKITNAGKTPSRILEVGMTFRRTENLHLVPPDPMTTYQKGEIFPFNKIVVPPNDHIPMYAALFPPLGEGEYSSFRNGKLLLYGYGYVKYLDVFSKDDRDFRETRFCHYYSIPTPNEPLAEGFRPCIEAPTEYHKAT